MTKFKYLLLFIFLIAAFFLLNILNDPDNFLKKDKVRQVLVYQPNMSITANQKKTDDFFPETGLENYSILRIGEEAFLDSDNFFTFVKVKEDNRCPKEVVCEISGKADVELILQNKKINNFKAQVEELRVEGFNRLQQDGSLKSNLFYPKEILTADGKKYTLTLRDLSPYPQKDFFTNVEAIKYVGLFYIEKLK
jgi:hypothetical protein